MSVLQTISVNPDAEKVLGKDAGDTRPAPDIGDVFDANIELGQDRSGYNRAMAFDQAYDALYNALDDAARARVDAKLRSMGIRDRETGRMPVTETGGDVPAYRQKVIWAEVDAARKANPALFANVAASQADYESGIFGKLKAARASNKDIANRSEGLISGVAGFGGGMVGAMSDPINVGSIFIGGPATGLAKQMLIGGLANAAVEAATIPVANAELAKLGDSETFGEQVQNVLMAGTIGVAFPLAIKVGGKTIDLTKDAAGKLYDKAVPLDVRLARALGKEKLAQLSDLEVAEIYAQAVPPQYRTPGEADALALLERQGQVKAANPYRNTLPDIDVHLAKVDEALGKLGTTIATGRAPPAIAPAAMQAGDGGSGFDMGSYLSRNRAAESSGNDSAAAETSSAFGRYQFLKGTWLSYYRKVYGETGESEAQILRKRADGNVQDALMARFTQDNLATLRKAGVPTTQGNAYLAHFLGPADAVKLGRAAADTPIGQLVSAASIKANSAVFGKIATAGDLVNWAARKMGGPVVPAQGSRFDGMVIEDTPYVRPAALDAVRPVVSAEGQRINLQAFSPADIDVDADLMQFKSGGDAQGVTERLRGVQQWDPIAAGAVTVWESVDGRRLIADGHQRLGLAKRMLADDPAQDIRLNAFVLREADGVSARDARIITALKNIGEGTGTMTDAAKVFREGGEMAAEALAKRLPPRSVLVRDGKALASLSDEAFGAVVNEVVPESWGAVVGDLVPDSANHMAMIELLAKLNPPNRRQAEGIIRQALQAGFARETQEELFGAREFSVALFAQKARAVERTLGELKKLKGLFSTAARNADTLEGAGNRIDAAASGAEAQANAEILGFVEKLAYVSGDVSEIFNAAAKRLSDGEPIARVVADAVAAIRELDINDIIRGIDRNPDIGIGRSGNAAFGSGRGGEPDGQAQSPSGDQLGPDGLRYRDGEPLDAGGLTASERAQLDYEEPGLGLFDDPAGDGPKMQVDAILHDVKATAEPVPVARETFLQQALDQPDNVKADPMASIAFAARDGADETIEQVTKGIEAEEAALKALRDCL